MVSNNAVEYLHETEIKRILELNVRTLADYELSLTSEALQQISIQLGHKNAS